MAHRLLVPQTRTGHSSCGHFPHGFPGIASTRKEYTREPKLDIAVYKSADPHYDFSVPPDFGSGEEFSARCYWVSPDGRHNGRGWAPFSFAIEGLAMGGKDYNRTTKFCPHDIFADVPVSLYVDGNVTISPPASDEIARFLVSSAEIGLCLHGEHRTIPEEIETCIARGKMTAGEARFAERRYAAYLSEGMPPDMPVYYGGVILRRHGSARVRSAMSDWAEEYASGLSRDQVSLPYILWRNNVKVHVFNNGYEDPPGAFFARRHRTGRFLSDLNEWRKQHAVRRRLG